MKKFFAIMMLLAGVMTFASCGDEPTADNPLIGTWTLDYSAPDAPDKDEEQSTIKFSKNMTYEWNAKSYYGPDDWDTFADKGTYEVAVEDVLFENNFSGEVQFKSSIDGDKWRTDFRIIEGKHLWLEGDWYIRK